MGAVFRRQPVDRKRVMQMHRVGTKPATIAWALGSSLTEIEAVIYEELGLPSADDPTPEEITAWCERFQASWDRETRDLAWQRRPRRSSPLVSSHYAKSAWRTRPAPVPKEEIAARRRERRQPAAIAQRAESVAALLSALNDAPPGSPAASQPISPAGCTASAPSTGGCTRESTSTQGPKRPEAEASQATTTQHEQLLEIDRCCTIS
jgi:hypothetical protein